MALACMSCRLCSRGTIQVQATAAGFSLYTVQKVTLSVDQNVTVNMKLAVCSAGETIEVESRRSQIETQTITVGQVIDRTTVQEIAAEWPALPRSDGADSGWRSRADGRKPHGAEPRPGSELVYYCGQSRRLRELPDQRHQPERHGQNQITFQPSINTTSEFKINNSTFSAEYGRSSGSIVNVSTRSGTNEFHGEAFDYFRNEGAGRAQLLQPPLQSTTGVSLGRSAQRLR